MGGVAQQRLLFTYIIIHIIIVETLVTLAAKRARPSSLCQKNAGLYCRVEQ